MKLKRKPSIVQPTTNAVFSCIVLILIIICILHCITNSPKFGKFDPLLEGWCDPPVFLTDDGKYVINASPSDFDSLGRLKIGITPEDTSSFYAFCKSWGIEPLEYLLPRLAE